MVGGSQRSLDGGWGSMTELTGWWVGVNDRATEWWMGVNVTATEWWMGVNVRAHWVVGWCGSMLELTE